MCAAALLGCLVLFRSLKILDIQKAKDIREEYLKWQKSKKEGEDHG